MLVFAMLFGLSLSTAPLAAAQGEDVDIAAVSETVLEAEPEALVEGLAEPPADEDLPEGFLNPPSGTPENADLAESFELPVSEFEGAVGSVNFPFDTDPEVIPGLISAGYLNYIVTEEEITDGQLEEFKTGAEEGLGTPDASIESSVEDITVGDTDGVLITVVTTQDDASAVVQLVALPVGNTFVIGTALVADEGEIDAADVQTLAEDLTVAGVAHLGIVAEDAQ
jgi:hypothetical protein